MRVLHAGAALVAAAVLVLVASPPASAHDELVSSDPVSGQRLDAAPESVSLTFSADVLTVGAAIVVADAEGKDWVSGTPAIAAGVVTVALSGGMPAAGYEVRWRVVSSDGHPISGLVPFTIGDGQRLKRDGGAAPAVADPTPGAAAAADAPRDDPGILRVLLIGAGGAAGAAVLFALFQLLRRRRGDRVVEPGE